MSTLVFLRAPESLARKKKDQKRGATQSDDPEVIRQQRQLYQNMLRRKKREQLLEQRRHVMQSLGWMSSVGNDELDKWKQEYVPPERLVQALTHSRTDQGSCLILSSAAEVVALSFQLMQRHLHMEIVLELIGNLMLRNEAFARSVVGDDLVKQLEVAFRDTTSKTQFLLCRITAVIARMGQPCIDLLLTARILPHLCEALYFGTGQTKHEVIEFLIVISASGSDEQIRVVFTADLVDAMEGVLTGDGEPTSAFRAMQVLRAVFAKRHYIPSINDLVAHFSDKHHDAIDRLFESDNVDVSALAAILLDLFL